MSEILETMKRLIEECSAEDRRALKSFLQTILPHPLESAWGVDADTILTAIRRSSDLTKRGVRGIIAEAVFDNDVLPTLRFAGWEADDLTGNQSYDVRLRKDERLVTIQIKLQRLERGVPKLYYPKHHADGILYVVEVQKTRSGEKTTVEALQGSPTKLKAGKSATIKTRPYRFGDFDILAVNMHPSSRRWTDFRYTLGSWLLPRQREESLIEIFQPVPAEPNEFWTDDIQVCLGWFEQGTSKRVLTHLLHLSKAKRKGSRPAKRSRATDGRRESL
jgi:hypothetical protein